ncbi:hypothetical protein AAIR98_000558 [Elusimicrobium simillimum]|uniref:hypothetical protein n=1 Tax=Elusimicrobium simillimum TaxID=3143438 RepID=UPI003C6ED39E
MYDNKTNSLPPLNLPGIANAQPLNQNQKINIPLYNENMPARKANQTIISWVMNLTENDNNLYELFIILSDVKYMGSDTVYTEDSCVDGYSGELQCELKLLTKVLPELHFSASESAAFVDLINKKMLRAYNSQDPQWEVYYRYSIIAASLLGNSFTGRAMLNALLDNIKKPGDAKYKVWSAYALSEVVYLRPNLQGIAIKEINDILFSLSNQLKHAYVENHHMGLKITNQAMAKKDFMYVVSFFAQKHDDGMIKGMLTDRIVTEQSHYFQTPLPGQDKNGDFFNTELGRKHNISYRLVTALFQVYKMGKKFDEMNKFILKYSRLRHDKSDFQDYFLFAMYALDQSMDIKENLSLDGWDEQYNTFLAAMSTVLWDLHPVIKSCVNTQGVAECSAQVVGVFLAFEVVLGALGFGASKGAQAAGRALTSRTAIRILGPKTVRNTLRCAKWTSSTTKTAYRHAKYMLPSFLVGAIMKQDTSEPIEIMYQEKELSKDAILNAMGY